MQNLVCHHLYEDRQLKLDFYTFPGKEQSETLLMCRRVFLSDMSCAKCEVKCVEMAGMSVVICGEIMYCSKL
jgi:hypothetical protein